MWPVDQDSRNFSCPCSEIIEVLNKLDKDDNDVDFIRKRAPLQFKEIDRYQDVDLATIIYILQCKACGRVIFIEH